MKAKSRIVNYLFFPFRYIAGGKSLLVGLLVLLILIFGGYFSHTYFDGVLDVHVGNAKEPSVLFTHIGYVSISWITVTLVFYLAARILSRSSVRMIDMAGTLALSQAPKIFLALVYCCLDNRGNFIKNWLVLLSNPLIFKLTHFQLIFV